MDTLHGRDKNVFFNACVLTKNLDRHQHAFLEIAYVHSGKVEHICNGKSYLADAGSYFVVDDGIPHEYRCRHGTAEVWNCIFRPDFVDASLRNCRDIDSVLTSYPLRFCRRFHFKPYSGRLFTDKDGSIEWALMHIREEYASQRAGREALMRAYLLEILIYTMRQLQEESHEELEEDIQELRKLVDTCYAQNLSLKQLAEERYCSPSVLSRRFEQACGCGFKEYQQDRRIEEACRPLANTQRKVADIAQTVGYQDLKFFNSLFMRKLGVSPSAYRRRYL